MKTPILFLTYRRFHTAEVVFNAIRKARPPKLYFASNAPNQNNFNEFARVSKVRSLIERVDWTCEIKTRFLEEHLPVKESISSSLSWFFEQEEQGIILEDDCLPHPDFFTFCENLLERYANDDRVWAITGNNFQNGMRRGDASYYFSRYSHIWGWASWRRAWQKADMDIQFWPEWKMSSAWRNLWPDLVVRKYWEQIFDRMYRAEIDTWDYPWAASVWYYGGLTATPNVNLVSNIGFGPDSTYTRDPNHPNAAITTSEIGVIRHTFSVRQDFEADTYTFNHHYEGLKMRFPLVIFYFPFRVLRYIRRIILNSENENTKL